LGYDSRTVPQGEVYGVPPCHLEVWTTKPTVIGKPSLLWGHGIGAVNLSEVLGEDDAALQFLGAWVGAVGEVDDGSFAPPTAPVTEGGLVVLVVFEAGGGISG
jgi:hypothetical protein